MEGKVGTEMGKHSDWCVRQLEQRRRVNRWHRKGLRAEQGARQGGGHGKVAEHGEGQVKWQSRADRKTQNKCEIE